MPNVEYSSDMKLTTNALIAPTVVDRLIAIRDSFDTNYWQLGDITNMVISQAIARGVGDIKMVLYQRVGQIVGKSPKMVRYYAAVSGFFQQEIREKYQLLPFSHFAFAMKFRERDAISFTETSKSAMILEYAVNNAAEYHGLPPSVASLSYRFEESVIEPLPQGVTSVKPADRRIASPDISVIDTFPITGGDGDERGRVEIIENRRRIALSRLSKLVGEIVPIVQFLGNPALSQVVSRLVESIRYFVENYGEVIE